MSVQESEAVSLSGRSPSPELLRLLPYDFMRRCSLVPFELRAGQLCLACSAPSDEAVLEQARLLSGREVLAFRASREEVSELLRRLGASHKPPSCPELALAPSGAGETGASRAVDRLFRLALERRASDIHLDPQRDGLCVRLRVDGTLNSLHMYPKAAQAAVISRVKVMANMDIAEKRLPQDGQIVFSCGGRDVDMRVSTLPGQHGEKVVIRLLDKSGMTPGLESLGFEPIMQGVFESLIERPHGLILVTGPTGSGKSTSLYAVLRRLRSPMKNIITLEDPIEYELLAEGADESGVTQVQMQSKIGLTFAAGLRASLRQDPDVIMLGEIRDKESAEIAMKAAMTGHLVLSTLHTNDAPSALSRLRDMGIEPYLIASTVAGVLAQRLVRLLCPECKEGYHAPERVLRSMFPQLPEKPEARTLYRPKGCARCQSFGYKGRKGIFELMLMDDELRRVVNTGCDLEAVRRCAREKGLKTLRQSGLELVLDGLTTAEEVFRNTVE